jgi:hypothetical protein
MILKAAIPVGAARKTGLPLPAVIVISCILAYTFRNMNIFLVPVSLLIFRNNYKKELLLGLISLV